MADVKQTQDTDLVWADSAQTPDENLTLTALADGAGRQGDEHDFGATFPERVRVALKCTFAVAPTAGEVVNVYWASSHDGTDYDAECGGTDAAFDAEPDATRLHWVGALSASNDTNVHQASWVHFMLARYGLPVLMNQSGQAFSTSNLAHKITVTPLIGDIT